MTNIRVERIAEFQIIADNQGRSVRPRRELKHAFKTIKYNRAEAGTPIYKPSQGSNNPVTSTPNISNIRPTPSSTIAAIELDLL